PRSTPTVSSCVSSRLGYTPPRRGGRMLSAPGRYSPYTFGYFSRRRSAMPHIVEKIFLALDESERLLGPKAAAHLGVKPQNITGLRVLKRSLDARKGHRLGFLYKVSVTLIGEPPDRGRSLQETIDF